MDSAENPNALTARSAIWVRMPVAMVVVGLAIASPAHAQPTSPTQSVQANPTSPQAAPFQTGSAAIDGIPTGIGEAQKTPINRGDLELENSARELSSGGNPIWTTLGVLCLLLAGLFGVLQLIRRYGPGRFAAVPTEHIELVDRRRLDSQTTIYLLRIGRRVIVAGNSAGGLNTLAEIDDPEEVADLFGSESSPESDGGSFSSLFSGARVIRRDEVRSESEASPAPAAPSTEKPQARQEVWHA